jgi:hypothetical protein
MNTHARTVTGPADDMLSRLIDDITTTHDTLMRALARLAAVAAAAAVQPRLEPVRVRAMAHDRRRPGPR